MADKDEGDVGGQPPTKAAHTRKTPRSRLHISFSADVAGSPTPPGSSAFDNAPSSLRVKFGLLKERCTYTADFLAPSAPSDGAGGNGAVSFAAVRTSGNVDVVLTEVPETEKERSSKDTAWYRATLFAARAGPISESYVATASATAASTATASKSSLFGVDIEGCVMGANRGTPSLKSGVHCVGIAPASESEVDSGPEWKQSHHAKGCGSHSKTRGPSGLHSQQHQRPTSDDADDEPM